MTAQTATETQQPSQLPTVIELTEARNGQKTLRADKKFLHSAYDPEKEAQQWAQKQIAKAEEASETLWVILGCGLGYQIKALLENGAQQILAYEPDPRIAELCRGVALLNKTNAILCQDPEQLFQLFRERYPSASATRIVTLPAFERSYKTQLIEVGRQLAAHADEFKVHRLTYIVKTAQWTNATAANLPSMLGQPSARTLTKLAKGWPAVVVAAGPSLDKNIDQLAAVQDQFLILCPSQSLKAAVAAGITPDLVLVLDAANLSYHFQGCPAESYGNQMLAVWSHPDVVALESQRRFFFYLRPNPLAQSFYQTRDGQPAHLSSGSSVANVAFNLAVEMQADPIILIGQDLCFAGDKRYANQAADGGGRLSYSQDGKAVSMGSFSTKLNIVDEKSRQRFAKELAGDLELCWVKGPQGDLLPTSRDLRTILVKLERDASELQGKHTLINATEGGAFIEGFAHHSFAEVVRRYGKTGSVSLNSRLAQAAPIDDQQKGSIRTLATNLVQDLEQIDHMAKRCLRLSKQALVGHTIDRSRLAKLVNAEKRLNKLIRQQPTAESVVQLAFSTFRAETAAKSNDLEFTVERSRALYTSISSAIDQLLSILSESQQRMN